MGKPEREGGLRRLVTRSCHTHARLRGGEHGWQYADSQGHYVVTLRLKLGMEVRKLQAKPISGGVLW